MEETKLTANLPHLDLEILHRRHPEAAAESVTIRLTATPSFEAVRNLVATNPMALFWLGPLAVWGQAVETVWRPWLAMLAQNSRPGR